jgi:amidase
MLEPMIMPFDAEVVARLRSAGAVFPGKTNLPEFGTIPSCEGGRFGAVHNPYDLSRTAGGSSGGSAAAVAAGLAPVAQGNDGGGSLRIPASCCGLFTVKPTRGRISLAPLVGDNPFGLLHEGFITRTVADSALLLDIASGDAPGDPYVAPPPQRPFAEEVGASAGHLRIGFTATPPIDFPVHDACVAAVRDAAALCESLGHRVEEFTPDWREDMLIPWFYQVWAAAIGSTIEFLTEMGGNPELCEPHNRALLELGQSLTATAYFVTANKLSGYVRRVAAAWQTYDVILTPTLAEPPLTLGTLFELADSDPMYPVNRAGMFTPFTPLINLTGQPAASLPLSTHDGLPIGVHAIGRFGDEATLFRLSAQLEEASPWVDRRPAIAS